MGNYKNISTTDLYKETCFTLRHYSGITLSIRLVTIIQGLFILGVTGKLIMESRPQYVLATCSFGLLFTLILLLLHHNYYRYFGFLIKYLCEFEEKNAENPEDVKDMLWNRFRGMRKGKIIHFLPFILIGGTFITLMLFTLLTK